MAFGNQGGIGFQNPAVVIANKVIIVGSADGLFVYNGSPSLGNPPILAITTASTDPYGNTVTPNTITDSAMPYLIYSGVPALGNLLISIAPASGSDSWGNTFQTGFQVHGTSGANIEMTTLSGVPFIFFSTGASEEGTAANIQGLINSPGAGEILTLIAVGPRGSTYTDYTFIVQSSSSKNGADLAGGALYYVDRSGAEHLYLGWGENGIAVFSPFSGDTNTYQTERITVVPSSAQTISHVTFSTIFPNVALGVGTYKIHGEILIGPNQAAGAAVLALAGGTAAGSVGLTMYEIAIPSPGSGAAGASFGNGGTINAWGGSLTFAAFGADDRLVTFTGYVTVTTAGDLNIDAACTVAADTYVVRQFGTWLEVEPIGE